MKLQRGQGLREVDLVRLSNQSRIVYHKGKAMAYRSNLGQWYRAVEAKRAFISWFNDMLSKERAARSLVQRIPQEDIEQLVEKV